MNDQNVMTGREQLSALADGELHGQAFVQAMAYASTDDGRACWQVYHLIGETLRRSDSHVDPAASATLLERLRAEMHSQAAPTLAGSPAVQQVALPWTSQSQSPAAVDRAANAEVLRWKLAAGFASLAAVAVLGWNAYVGLGQAAGQGAQLASAPAAAVAAPSVLAANDPPGLSAVSVDGQDQGQIMLRDPRLDELLAAHRQLGNNTSALQMPAGFLRNANFARRER